MKNITYILLTSLLAIGIISCKQDEILKERPKDFLTPANSFNTPAAFESALANIYLNIRQNTYEGDGGWTAHRVLGAGADLGAYYPSGNLSPIFNWNTLNADDDFSRTWWTQYYNWIGQANVIIDRAGNEAVKWSSEEEKNVIVGEARFLRAFAYHFLANMWGGVPLVLHETTGPKFDYYRSSQDSVYQQCKEDLEFAVKWMKPVDQLPGGRAPRAAAYTLLSEVYISMKKYDEAIKAASAVIDNPNFQLMTERFGALKNFTFSGYTYQGAAAPWGDVYWDLFIEGNFNWKTGNHEAIWNAEFDVSAKGGGGLDISSNGGDFNLERNWGGPLKWLAKDKNGVVDWLQDTLSGRPVGFLFGTEYSNTTIWKYKGDWDRDIRNSKYNIQREYYWTNPSSAFYGQLLAADNMGDPSSLYAMTTPSFKKAVSAVHHGLFTDATSGKKHDNGHIYKDWYIMRLPDTYLLRAEAYYLKGNPEKAAEDINAIRNRVHATPVGAGDVNLDLILDERARELFMEDFRLNTLMRMGKLVEYLMKYNPVVIKNGWQLDDHLNKLPIPNSEIEANTGSKLEQNPGY